MKQVLESMARYLSVLLLWGLLVLPLLGGCAGSKTAALGSEPAVMATSVPVSGSSQEKPVRLKPGDEMEIKFAYAEQFNETQVIGPDGVIRLQLIGPVVAAGKTPNELREELMRRYAVELRHPELVVIVRSLYDRRVYVGGAVKTPGLVDMPGRLTALEAIIQAGGIDRDLADAKQVVVIRNATGNRRNFLLDLEDQVEGARNQVFVLEPRDVVYVPRTTIADVNLWVKQHIYNLLPPFTFAVGYSF